MVIIWAINSLKKTILRLYLTRHYASNTSSFIGNGRRFMSDNFLGENCELEVVV